MLLVMLELLWHPTPELPCTLKDAIAVLAWEYGGYCGVLIPEQSRMACGGVVMFAQCCQREDCLKDRPGNRPGIQVKLPVKHMAGG